MITEEAILKAQKEWGDGLVRISQKHQDNEDYIVEASNFIDDLYAFSAENVFFKPTLASKDQFRLNRNAALSYFVGGDSRYQEDIGFALQAWKTVRFENVGFKIEGDIAIAMGNYYFANNEGEKKVEYTFIYRLMNGNKLLIILHDSHLPYNP